MWYEKILVITAILWYFLAAWIPTLILYCSIAVPIFPSIRFLGIFLIILTTSCATISQEPQVMHYVDGILVSSECQNCDEVD